LETITDHVVTPGAAPDLVNGSALVTMRTNEAFLDHSWEMREFRLKVAPDDGGHGDDDKKNDHDQPQGKLLPAFLELTPAVRLQGTQTLADYINLATPDILAGNQAAPITFRGEPFLAGVAPNHLDLNWDGPSPACGSETNLNARRIFSSLTCQGCHGPETGTTFRHVSPRQIGQASQISEYLTGLLVVDFCNVSVRFNDLLRRRRDLCFLITRVCPAP
jgi:hypothetical protein